MGIFSRRQDREDEDQRAAFPKAWAMAEHLANFQFRDWVFFGLEPAPQKDFQELAEAYAPEVWDRYTDMEHGPHDDPRERVAFVRAFTRRVVHLGDEYRRMPDDSDPDSIATGMTAALRPESAAGIVTEARNARLMDDMAGGPTTAYAMSAQFARNELGKRSWGDMTINQVAQEEPALIEAMMANEILRGQQDLDDAIEILPEREEAFRQAAAIREGRLRGGPLTLDPRKGGGG